MLFKCNDTYNKPLWNNGLKKQKCQSEEPTNRINKCIILSAHILIS